MFTKQFENFSVVIQFNTTATWNQRLSDQFTDLHLVDVGRVVPLSTAGGDGFTAAVGHQPALCWRRGDVHAGHPVVGVVTAAALELDSQRGGGGGGGEQERNEQSALAPSQMMLQKRNFFFSSTAVLQY